MYFDPGFGSMIIQAVLAVLAAGGVVWLTLRKRLKTIFSKKKNTNDDPGEQDEQ
jgi:hypothetical protein